MPKPEDSGFYFDDLNMPDNLSDLNMPDNLSDGLEGFDQPGEEQSLPELQQAETEPDEMIESLEEEQIAPEQAEAELGEMAAVEHQQPLAAEKVGFLHKLSTADPFSVMLSVALAALLVTILICLVELGRYHRVPESG